MYSFANYLKWVTMHYNVRNFFNCESKNSLHQEYVKMKNKIKVSIYISCTNILIGVKIWIQILDQTDGSFSILQFWIDFPKFQINRLTLVILRYISQVLQSSKFYFELNFLLFTILWSICLVWVSWLFTANALTRPSLTSIWWELVNSLSDFHNNEW